MTMLLNEEQRLLRDSAQDFLAARSPVEAMRRLRDTRDPLGYDPTLWREVAAMGWTAAVVPEAWGGLDFGYKGLGAVFEEMGRTLAPLPLLSSVVMGAGLLLEAGNDTQRTEWLPAVTSGERLLALALEEQPRHDPAGIATQAVRCGDGWVLDGEKWFVVDGHVADSLLVAARTAGRPGDSDGIGLFLVDPRAPGVHVERTWMVDARNAARVRLDRVEVGPEAVLGEPGGGYAALDAVLDRARVCVAAETLGVVREAFARTVTYLKDRVQFDVPIGSFQALQHRAARLYTAIELSHSCVAAALDAIDAGSDDLALLASLAKASTADLSEKVLNETVQMHGGIGVTDELDIGLFLKRGRVLQQCLGDGVYHRDRYATLKGF
jgi:alkylation response protein AidB-like acyl-CoA dehydrogenase